MTYSFDNKGIIVILEGVDGSGKSTLAESLRKVIRGLFVKITDIPKIGNDADRSKIKEYYWMMLGIQNDNPNTNLIFDRFFPSELVYSKVKRGYEAGEDPEYSSIEEDLLKRKHLIVLCDPGLDVIKDRLSSRGDDYVLPEDLDELYARYELLFKTLKTNVLILDTNQPVEVLAAQIGDKLNELYEHKRDDGPEQLELFGG